MFCPLISAIGRDADAVFGMKESLVAKFELHPPGIGPDGARLTTPFYTVDYDFRLRRAGAAARSDTPTS
jgi:hydroxyquinol 1,2-dioxygenase